MFRCDFFLSTILVAVAYQVAAQVCPTDPYADCGGRSCDSGVPVFSQSAEPGSQILGSCDVTLTWYYPENENEISPTMVFYCSYDDGTACADAEIDICAVCQTITYFDLDMERNPSIVYSDTCGNLDTISINTDCNQATTIDMISTIPPVTCQGAFENIGGRCLFVDPFIDARWDEARYFCSEFDADLASLDDDEIYLAVLQYIQSRNFGSSSFWLGASDRFYEGTYLWLSGSEVQEGTPYWAVNYSGTQEPSDVGLPNFDCLHMDGQRFLYFDDDDCLSYKSLICQKN